LKLLLLFLLLASPVVAQEPYARSIKVDLLLKTTKDEAGRPVKYPTNGTANGTAELAAYLVEIPPGETTGWHTHQNPSLAYILEGVIDVEYEDGSRRQYRAGETLAEVVEFKHNGINKGKEPVRILLFVAGAQGTPVSTRSEPPK
jgi:quercetin dioxygenase-like cupin family protein